MKSKLLILSTIFWSLLLIPEVGRAQEPSFEKSIDGVELTSTKYGVLVADIPHLGAALEVAQKLRVKANDFKFEVVIIGGPVKSLVEDPEYGYLIDKSEELGVRLTLCENTIKKRKIDTTNMDKRFYTTPNGMIRIFELNDQGYNTVTIQRAR